MSFPPRVCHRLRCAVLSNTDAPVCACRGALCAVDATDPSQAAQALLGCLRRHMAAPSGIFCAVIHAGPTAAETLSALERAAGADGSPFVLAVRRAPLGLLRQATEPADETVWLGRPAAGEWGGAREGTRREVVAAGLPYALLEIRWRGAG